MLREVDLPLTTTNQEPGSLQRTIEPPRTGRPAAWAVLFLAVVYAPIGLSSMWFAFVPGAPRLQELLDGWVAGEAYATGAGSLSAVRSAEYVDHRILMLGHTTLGGVALLLAAGQLVAAGRARRRTHRALGQVHLVLVTISMAAAIAFLLVSPAVPGLGQTAFRWQLWVLALSTLGSAWLSAASARRGDLRAHRAWLTLHLAFLLTAPLLRLLWTLLAAVVPHEMLTNIETGAVLLAVAAPAGAATAFVARMDTSGPTPRLTKESGPPTRGRVLLLVALAAGGMAAVATASTDRGLGTYAWFHVAPVAVYAAVCVAGVRRAVRVGSTARALAWETLLKGAVLAPWAVIAVGVAAALVLGFEEGVLAGLMVGPGFPVAASVAHLVRAERVERVE